MKKILSSQASHELRHNDLEALSEDEEPKTCKHSLYCVGTKYPMKCIFGQDNCGLKSFYNRYGDYRQMFVGSKI